jgi:hypothetical protein
MATEVKKPDKIASLTLLAKLFTQLPHSESFMITSQPNKSTLVVERPTSMAKSKTTTPVMATMTMSLLFVSVTAVRLLPVAKTVRSHSSVSGTAPLVN